MGGCTAIGCSKAIGASSARQGCKTMGRCRAMAETRILRRSVQVHWIGERTRPPSNERDRTKCPETTEEDWITVKATSKRRAGSRLPPPTPGKRVVPTTWATGTHRPQHPYSQYSESH
jgi:hypothetical protein